MKLAISIALVLFSSTGAKAERIVDISVDDVMPTQMEVGMAHVIVSEANIQKRAPEIPDGVLTRVLPAVIGPDGKAYITDGHHWATATSRLRQKHPELADKIKLRVRIEGDFTGKSWQEFAEFLYDRGTGYFTREALEPFLVKGPDGKRHVDRSRLEELYRTRLPKHLEELKDNPGRSLIGLALESMGIEAEFDLVDYIEFFVAEHMAPELEAHHLGAKDLADPSSITPEKIAQARWLIASDPQVVKFLLKRPRPGVDPRQARSHVLDKVNHYRRHTLRIPDLPCAAIGVI